MEQGRLEKKCGEFETGILEVKWGNPGFRDCPSAKNYMFMRLPYEKMKSVYAQYKNINLIMVMVV
jgi:hypothetical protein